jgi:hypothetical protein
MRPTEKAFDESESSDVAAPVVPDTGALCNTPAILEERQQNTGIAGIER